MKVNYNSRSVQSNYYKIDTVLFLFSPQNTWLLRGIFVFLYHIYNRSEKYYTYFYSKPLCNLTCQTNTTCAAYISAGPHSVLLRNFWTHTKLMLRIKLYSGEKKNPWSDFCLYFSIKILKTALIF